MFLEIAILIAGLVLVVTGAEALVKGASSIARKTGISEFVIGLTIVGMGTSAPEMVVSFVGAIKGNASISIGNVVGSNIFNTLLILGLSAFILPIAITKENKKKDIPANLLITLGFILVGMSYSLFGLGTDSISRIGGAVFLAVFAIYMYMAFKNGKSQEDVDAEPEEILPTWKSILYVVAGLAALVFGGQFFVDSAEQIAKALGVSDKFIAITILAGGTSMPELATCVVAAIQKKGQLALGNILGSNIFNLLLILGGSALISPLSLGGMDFVDLGVLLLSAVLILTSSWTGKKNMLDRFDGFILLLTEAAYLVWLFMKL